MRVVTRPWAHGSRFTLAYQGGDGGLLFSLTKITLSTSNEFRCLGCPVGGNVFSRLSHRGVAAAAVNGADAACATDPHCPEDGRSERAGAWCVELSCAGNTAQLLWRAGGIQFSGGRWFFGDVGEFFGHRRAWGGFFI